MVPNTASFVLKNATIHHLNESAVSIHCVFKDGITGASCILIYRANYDEDELTVLEYNQTLQFPVIVRTTDNLNISTCAIFGKNQTHFDAIPFTSYTSGE